MGFISGLMELAGIGDPSFSLKPPEIHPMKACETLRMDFVSLGSLREVWNCRARKNCM